jgi:hypothetical protein
MIEGSLTKALLEAVPAVLPGLAEAAAPQAATSESQLKKIGLFMAAPFIGLVYAVLLPFVGLGTLAYLGLKALRRNVAAMKAVKFITLLVASPLIGLFFILALPLLGAAALVWVMVHAWTGARTLIGKAQTG